MKTIICYVRVSTDEQAREGVSLDAQVAKAHAWRDLNAPDAELLVFRDEGISGTRTDRPGLDAALEAAEQAQEVVFLVYSLSRLSRSTTHTLELAERLEKAGADLVSLSERIDTTSAAGKMVFRMLAVLAEFERDQIAERTRAAMCHLRNTGQRFSRFSPYPQETVEQVKHLRARGLSYRVIGRELLARGIRPQEGGDTWSPKVVRSLALRHVGEHAGSLGRAESAG